MIGGGNLVASGDKGNPEEKWYFFLPPTRQQQHYLFLYHTNTNEIIHIYVSYVRIIVFGYSGKQQLFRL